MVGGFIRVLSFLHHYIWSPWHGRTIVESGVKTPKIKPKFIIAETLLKVALSTKNQIDERILITPKVSSNSSCGSYMIK
jgi:hypothetical protein